MEHPFIRYIVKKVYQYRDYLQKIEDRKVYLVLITAVVFFALVGTNVFYNISHSTQELILQNQNLMIANIKHKVNAWVLERVLLLRQNADLIAKIDLSKNPDGIRIFDTNILAFDGAFDSTQMLLDDGRFYVNGKKYPYTMRREEIFNQEWFKKTHQLQTITITMLESHRFLKDQTINMCIPIAFANRVNGVFCGVTRVKSLFDHIESLPHPNAYFFIVNDDLKVITHPETSAFQKDLQAFLKTLDHKKIQEDHAIAFKQYSITLSRLKRFDWNIGVALDSKKILQSSLKPITIEGGFFFLCFVLLVIFTNTCYEFLRRKVDLKCKEYEHLLFYRSKLIEMGENIGMINHQLRQPINSLSLLTESMLLAQQNKTLDEKTLVQNLLLCKKSLGILENTIETFRKFYRYDTSVKDFSLLGCIEDIIEILSPQLNLKNIQINTEACKDIRVVSFETYIQQILFVLIQNAKDAIIEAKAQNPATNNQITITTNEIGNTIEVMVQDEGIGIDNGFKDCIFNKIQTSKKAYGTGFGLYFSKKMALEKLQGDLEILSFKHPTIFKFSFQKHLTGAKTDAYPDA
ncbi:sensor histidine kinase [Helicobacter sp. 11S02596-1]|uniref:sensor histidine kinase n=1 Tax=Helicobacter sp. 11S02596-1 TaxID=1476194 RepID=UPI000BA4FECD|nr:sensor histidine kinase [Helicobacter sp. 11S02596-1]PAF44525.1 hypothetical protein BJI48_03125 [Helicobacter sp. 11S02596-1]